MSTNHQKLENLFAQAAELTPGRRADFLALACAGDPELRQAVEELLQAQDALGAFLPDAPCETKVTSIPVAEKPGDNLGRYKLLQQIGEGGCGVVYMAEQTEPVRRRVALKVIKLGMDTKSVIARFEAERQALALMDHPNIAKVLDAGATPAGRPYFVMELVKGIRITEYCDRNKLSTSERLALFKQVCHAIQHAHQKGIIHRDIKPSNILVTLHDGVPAPKIIDFGIAKATDQQLADKTVFTIFGQFIGTPAYMSPEQAEMNGLDVDTRSDIYSLGVLLYELLTGTTPFAANQLVQRGLDEMRRTIRESEPPRPSTKLSTLTQADLSVVASARSTESLKLGRQLRGDLDWITMKCLEKDRTRRYEAATGLAGDIQRHLNHEPVSAAAPSLGYRFTKFVRRQRLLVSFVAISAFLLLGGIVATSIQARRANAFATHARRIASDLAQNLYAAEIYLAQRALLEGDFGLARRRLESLKPASGQPEMRGFEWRYLWQLSQGQSLRTWPAHSNAVHWLTVSPDNKLLASVSCDDHEGKLWDAATGRHLRTFEGTDMLLFSPEGDLLFASSSSENVDAWNVKTLQKEFSLSVSGPLATERPVVRLAISPIQPWLAVCRDGSFFGRKGSIRIYDYRSRSEIARLDKSGDRAVFSPDGHTLVTGSAGGVIHVWELPSGKETKRLGPVGGISSLAISPDGSLLACTEFWKKEIRLWDLNTGKELPAFRGHESMLWQVAFAPDGKTLASGSSDQVVMLWDIRTGRMLQRLHGHQSEVWSLAYTPDGKQFYSAGKDAKIFAWPTEFVERQNEFKVANTRESVPLFDNQGRLIATGHGPGETVTSVSVRETESLRVYHTLDGEQAALHFSNDRRSLWTLSTNSQLHLWLLEKPVIQRSIDLAPIVGTASRAVVSPDGAWAAVLAGERTRVRFVNLPSSEIGPALSSELNAIASLAVSPDSRLLALGGRNAIEVWDQTSRQLAARFQAHKGEISSLEFSPDGRLLGSTSSDGTAQIRRVGDWSIMAIFAGHREGLTRCSFAPDGRTFVTSCDDGTVKLWHLATHREMVHIKPLSRVWYVGFSPDGRTLACAPGWGPMRLLRCPTLDENESAEPNEKARSYP